MNTILHLFVFTQIFALDLECKAYPGSWSFYFVLLNHIVTTYVAKSLKKSKLALAIFIGSS